MVDNQPQPGRELDEAIALLLGWKQLHGVAHTPLNGAWMDGALVQEHPPLYSTDDRRAMATLEQLNKPAKEGGHDLYVEIEFPAGKDRNYYVSLVRDVGRAWLGDGSTLAYAAALAMKAALEAEK